MTLNITLLTQTIIYQAADYALVDLRTHRPLTTPSTKVAVLNFFDWTGFVTYTGIGSLEGRQTREYINEWVAELDQPSFQEVVERIQSKSTAWVKRACPAERHTFIVAAFVAGAPTAAVISNFQEWHGADFESVHDALEVSIVRARRGAQIVVTGVREAVPRPRRRALQKLAEAHPLDGARIRRAIAKAFREANQRFPSLISADCFVYSQDVSGNGHYEPMGSAPTENPMMLRGASMDSLVRKLLDEEYGPGRWSVRGITSGRGHTSLAPLASCVLEQATLQKTAEYRLDQLATTAGRRAAPESINERGIIVGSGSRELGGPSHPCIWLAPTHVEFLSNEGALEGRARRINDSGVIAGSLVFADGASRAHRWHFDGSVRDIGALVARHSQAHALNEAGSVVGWASADSSEGGQAHARPALWPWAGTPIVLRDLHGGWGEAVDINDAGLTLIRVHPGTRHLSGESGAWLWHGGKDIEFAHHGAHVAAVYPYRLTNDGRIVCLTIMRDGSRCAEIRATDGRWARLFAPSPGRELTAANRQLMVAGCEYLDDYRVPWIMHEGGDLAYLPFYRFHHHRVSAISEGGVAVGTAISDTCCHPIIWTPL